MTTLTLEKGTERIILEEIVKGLDVHEGEEIDIHKDKNKVIIKKVDNIADASDFLPKDFGNVQKRLRKDSTERFKRLGII